MPRVKKSSVNKKHKKLKKKTKGYIGRRKNIYRIAKQAYIKSLLYARRDRKKNKARYRRESIRKINEYIKDKELKTSYSRFIKIVSEKGIIINRKIFGILTREKYKHILERLIKKEQLGC
ncbi:50S ribosomal protein L20 [Candidatus Vidania fulgoroideorum]